MEVKIESHLSSQELTSGIYKILPQFSNQWAWLSVQRSESSVVMERLPNVYTVLLHPQQWNKMGDKNLSSKHF